MLTVVKLLEYKGKVTKIPMCYITFLKCYIIHTCIQQKL
jgi:hypothetical protein